MDELSSEHYRGLIDAALAEDVGDGDATSIATIDESLKWSAAMVAREPMIACGLGIARDVFLRVDPELEVEFACKEGDALLPGTTLMTIRGSARSQLTAERTALNFVQRLSGIATITAAYVQLIDGTGTKLLDTRKTLPGWRMLEKYAVKCGGGTNHRIGLFDLILIKDNHLAALAGVATDPMSEAIKRARAAFPNLRVEVEADTLEQARIAVDAAADIVLLDNMRPEQLREAVEMAAGRCKLEASGGINLRTVRSIAETGVDFVSVGAITHSATAVDIALDFETGQ